MALHAVCVCFVVIGSLGEGGMSRRVCGCVVCVQLCMHIAHAEGGLGCGLLRMRTYDAGDLCAERLPRCGHM